MLFLSLQVFIFPNILICYKSIPLKWAHMGTWLFLKLCGWDWSSVLIRRPAWLVVLLKHLAHSFVFLRVESNTFTRTCLRTPSNLHPSLTVICPKVPTGSHLCCPTGRLSSHRWTRAPSHLPILKVVLFVENILRSDVLALCLTAIFFWVCVWWDQGPAQARVSLRCGVLSV